MDKKLEIIKTAQSLTSDFQISKELDNWPSEVGDKEVSFLLLCFADLEEARKFIEGIRLKVEDVAVVDAEPVSVNLTREHQAFAVGVEYQEVKNAS